MVGDGLVGPTTTCWTRSRRVSGRTPGSTGSSTPAWPCTSDMRWTAGCRSAGSRSERGGVGSAGATEFARRARPRQLRRARSRGARAGTRPGRGFRNAARARGDDRGPGVAWPTGAVTSFWSAIPGTDPTSRTTLRKTLPQHPDLKRLAPGTITAAAGEVDGDPRSGSSPRRQHAGWVLGFGRGRPCGAATRCSAALGGQTSGRRAHSAERTTSELSAIIASRS